MRDVSFSPAGDCAVSVCFGDEISEAVNARVTGLERALGAAPIPGVAETVPTYRSLLVYYDPRRASYGSMVRRLRGAIRSIGAGEAASGRIFEIPVLYGGAYGEDLPDVAAHTGLPEDEVVARHSGKDYLIYMLGFLPGFAYLGGLDPSLATPRLTTPRQAIPAGSVGIGGEQTGIYPLKSPGGWRLIGTTPVKPYDPARAEPILYSAGDRIRFRPVGKAEFDDIARRVEAGDYSYAVAGGKA